VIAPHREAEPEASAWLDTIPGVSQRPAEIRLADMGTDRARFPTATPRASGAGRCPGHDESGGPRLRGKTRQGRRWRRQVRVEAAHVAAHNHATFPGRPVPAHGGPAGQEPRAYGPWTHHCGAGVDVTDPAAPVSGSGPGLL
jgi:Transposase IS116/IS110/IS902 family